MSVGEWNSLGPFRKEGGQSSECCSARVVDAALAKAVSWGHLGPKSGANLQKWVGVNQNTLKSSFGSRENNFLK